MSRAQFVRARRDPKEFNEVECIASLLLAFLSHTDDASILTMWNVRTYQELPSTNALAKEELLRGEAKHGDVVQAHHQSAGRGRLQGRMWFDNPGDSLLMSIVLERLPLPRVELIQYQAALSIARAFRTLVDPDRVRVKWPNDLMIDSRKVCGMLSEGLWQAQFLRGIVLGVGVNVRQAHFPDHLKSATSLRMAGVDTQVADVRDLILRELERSFEHLESLPGHVVQMSILGELRAELEWMRELHGFAVMIDEGSAVRASRYLGIADNAGMVLELPDGTQTTVHTGTLDIHVT